MKVYRTDSDHTPRFDERMQSVAKSIIEERPNIFPMINTLHDRKGVLNVYWNEQPSRLDKAFIELLWEKHYEFEVEHHHDSEPSLSPVGRFSITKALRGL